MLMCPSAVSKLIRNSKRHSSPPAGNADWFAALSVALTATPVLKGATTRAEKVKKPASSATLYRTDDRWHLPEKKHATSNPNHPWHSNNLSFKN